MKATMTRLPKKPASLRLEQDSAFGALKMTSLAMSVSTAMLASFAPLAAQAQTVEKPQRLPDVEIIAKRLDPNPNAEAGVPYKAKTSADSRHTRPLAETPQTIAVVTKAAIDDAGVTDLKQILAAQPGITLGTGENGNAFGDRYIIRGQEARSDVFVDGLRDPGMSTRESFAIEQLEISKGPNSSFAGRGTAGGAINAITKQATLDHDFTRFSGAIGTDAHHRVSADINKGIGENFALRANVLEAKEDVPDRAPSRRERRGVALSGLYDASPDFSVTLDYYGLRTHDKMPDLGGYLTGTVPNRVPASNVPVYAQAGDFLESDLDTFTARVNWKLAPNLKLTSLTRYGTAENAYVTTGASAGTRYSGTSTVGFPTAYIDNGHTGWQEVDYFAHQSNLRWDKQLGGLKHEFIFGVEYTDHKVKSGTFALNNSGFNCRNPNTVTNPDGTTTVQYIGAKNSFCFTTPAGAPVADLSTLATRNTQRLDWNQDWQVKTTALSIMDTVDLTDKLTAFAGIRADHFDLDLTRRTTSATAAPVLGGVYGYNDTLVNGHLGLSYKVAKDAIVYASAGTAQDINGGEADAGTASGYGGAVLYKGNIAGAEPESSTNLELGTKWDLFDHKLLATAALFQTTKRDVMEGANYDTVGTFNTGKNRVRGIEFGLVGDLTDKLSGQIGGAIMSSKVLGSATASNIGNPLSNFAKRSYSAQLKYAPSDAFAFGTTVRYESDRCGGQPDTGAGITNGLCAQPVPSFTVFDLFASYRFSRRFDLRLNVINAGDKDYYTAVYRSGSFLYKGDARAVRLTANYEL
jgi:catecholate siderophore receptor